MVYVPRSHHIRCRKYRQNFCPPLSAVQRSGGARLSRLANRATRARPNRTGNPMKAPRTHVRLALACAASALVAVGAHSTANAQDNLQAQQFFPMPAQQSNYFHTARAATPDGGTWELGLVLNYARNPLVIQSAVGDDALERNGAIITDQLVLDLNAAVSLADWLELGVALPIYLYDNGDTGQGFGRYELEDSPNPGVGDLRIVPRVQLFEWGGDEQDRFALGLMLNVFVPTASNDGVYQGEDAVRLEPRLAFDAWFADWVVWSLNGGVVIRPEEVSLENISSGQTVTFGSAAAFRVTEDDTVFLVPEVVGAVSIARGDDVDLEEVPMELRGGVKWFPRNADGLMIEGGAGAGLIEGFGTPDFRLFAGLSYSPDREQEPVCFPTDYPDDDGDRLCETPADFGPECDICRPRLDGDFPESYEIADYAAREDAAHYWRYSYYPGADTDDGIDVDDDGYPDACDICRPVDACDPLYRTDDDVDSDGDGIPDGCDYCPQGGDLVDTDGDCIVDCRDECPEDPETWNDDFDEDGCPEIYECSEADVCPENLDEFPIVDQVYGGVPFFFDYDVHWEFSERVTQGYDRATNEVLLAQMAAILVDLADCMRYRLRAEGHTDTDGNEEYNVELGMNRANYVRTQLIDALVEAGMDPAEADAIVEADTFGEGDPINPDDPDDDYAPGNRENRRVILRIIGCDEIGNRGPASFQPTCPDTSVGVRCGGGVTR